MVIFVMNPMRNVYMNRKVTI